MGYFEFKKGLQEKKKERLIGKLARAEENAQKGEILKKKELELESIKKSIRGLKPEPVRRDASAAVGVVKSVGRGAISIGKTVGSVLGEMAEKQQANIKQQKKKKDDFDPFNIF